MCFSVDTGRSAASGHSARLASGEGGGGRSREFTGSLETFRDALTRVTTIFDSIHTTLQESLDKRVLPSQEKITPALSAVNVLLEVIDALSPQDRVAVAPQVARFATDLVNIFFIRNEMVYATHASGGTDPLPLVAQLLTAINTSIQALQTSRTALRGYDLEARTAMIESFNTGIESSLVPLLNLVRGVKFTTEAPTATGYQVAVEQPAQPVVAETRSQKERAPIPVSNEQRYVVGSEVWMKLPGGYDLTLQQLLVAARAQGSGTTEYPLTLTLTENLPEAVLFTLSQEKQQELLMLSYKQRIDIATVQDSDPGYIQVQGLKISWEKLLPKLENLASSGGIELSVASETIGASIKKYLVCIITSQEVAQLLARYVKNKSVLPTATVETVTPEKVQEPAAVESPKPRLTPEQIQALPAISHIECGITDTMVTITLGSEKYRQPLSEFFKRSPADYDGGTLVELYLEGGKLQSVRVPSATYVELKRLRGLENDTKYEDANSVGEIDTQNPNTFEMRFATGEVKRVRTFSILQNPLLTEFNGYVYGGVVEEDTQKNIFFKMDYRKWFTLRAYLQRYSQEKYRINAAELKNYASGVASLYNPLHEPAISKVAGISIGNIGGAGELALGLTESLAEQGITATDIITNQENSARVDKRYRALVAALAERVQLHGGIAKYLKIETDDLNELFQIAARVELSGPQMINALIGNANKRYLDNVDLSQIYVATNLQQYFTIEQEVFNHVAVKVLAASVREKYRVLEEEARRAPKEAPEPQPSAAVVPERRAAAPQQAAVPATPEAIPAQKTPDQIAGDDWLAWARLEKQSGKQAEAQEQKEHYLAQLAQQYSDVISGSFSAVNQGQPYYYFYPKVHDHSVVSAEAARTKGVNDAQDSLVREARQMGADAVRKIPTGKLKDQLRQLETIGQEVKIHLMPLTHREPEVMRRIFELFRRNPDLCDLARPLKLRIVGNNSPSDNLPELVLYTTKDSYPRVVAALLEEFQDMSGSIKVPRFNAPIDGQRKDGAGPLFYVAESGGDLKEALQGMGLLDKLFEKTANHAKARW